MCIMSRWRVDHKPSLHLTKAMGTFCRSSRVIHTIFTHHSVIHTTAKLVKAEKSCHCFAHLDCFWQRKYLPVKYLRKILLGRFEIRSRRPNMYVNGINVLGFRWVKCSEWKMPTSINNNQFPMNCLNLSIKYDFSYITT